DRPRVPSFPTRRSSDLAKTPIGEFTSSGVCQNVSFDRYVVKAWFDGPNITSPLVPSPNWPNPSSLPKLTIDTFASENGTMLDTADRKSTRLNSSHDQIS